MAFSKPVLHTHTVRKADGQHRVFAEPSYLTSQSFFGGSNTKTNSRDELQAGGFDIFPSAAAEYLLKAGRWCAAM